MGKPEKEIVMGFTIGNFFPSISKALMFLIGLILTTVKIFPFAIFLLAALSLLGIAAFMRHKF